MALNITMKIQNPCACGKHFIIDVTAGGKTFRVAPELSDFTGVPDVDVEKGVIILLRNFVAENNLAGSGFATIKTAVEGHTFQL